jgi:uncharacterized protein (TIGR00251 family)
MPINLNPQLWIAIYLQPNASKDAVLGLHNNEVKIAVTSPPVDGKANKHLVKYLAKLTGVAKSNVVIVKGQQSRHKLIKIENMYYIPDAFSNLTDD